MGLQVARREGRGRHARRGWAGHGPAGRGNEATDKYWDVQRRTYGQKSRQPNDEASKESDSEFVPLQARRPRPIPLPPSSSRSSCQRAKPFIILLPALKPKTPLSGLPTPLVPRPGCRVGKSIQGTLRHRSTERLI